MQGTDDLKTFVQTWAAHCGAKPVTFRGQLAVTLAAELDRAMMYACHLEACVIFELVNGAPDDDDECSCGLVELREYVHRLDPRSRVNNDG